MLIKVYLSFKRVIIMKYKYYIVLFLWIVALIITIIYIVAMIRAIVQRKNESSGIPKGVYRFGTVSTVMVIGYMVVWFILFNKIAFFSMLPP